MLTSVYVITDETCANCQVQPIRAVLDLAFNLSERLAFNKTNFFPTISFSQPMSVLFWETDTKADYE